MINQFINEYFIIVVFICLILHFTIGIFLNKIYYRKENKNTPMAFIPLANVYLLASLAIHSFVGWILVILIMLNINYPIVIDNKVVIKRILPENFGKTISLIVIFSIIILLIILLFRKNKKQELPVNNNFLTEAELMKDPTHLKKQAQISIKKETIDINQHNNFNQPRLNNNPPLTKNIPQHSLNNTPQMPKSFNQQKSFNNQNSLYNNNPFNKRGL